MYVHLVHLLGFVRFGEDVGDVQLSLGNNMNGIDINLGVSHDLPVPVVFYRNEEYSFFVSSN